MNEAQKRQRWQEKLAKAKSAYGDTLERMTTRNDYYNGSHKIRNADGTVGKADATNVRNIVYELIESQVDSGIPAPKVTAIHAEDKDLAHKIEALLWNEAQLLRLKEMNDLQERTVPIQGGDFWHIEWNPFGGMHCNMGALAITDRHPSRVIPQPGVYDIPLMDYVFILVSQTKESIKRRYGIDVDAEGNSDPLNEEEAGNDELVTQNIAYYKNDNGGIGVFSWVNDVTLEDLEDYQARRAKVCKKCGARQEGDVCPQCGGRKFIDVALKEEELMEGITIAGGETISAYGDPVDMPLIGPDGMPMLDDETGEPIIMPGERPHNKIPYYKPDAYPVILRRNVWANNQLLGASDVDAVSDQQDAINKYGTKIQEKLLKGGSYVTLPEGVNVETTDRELKVLRVKNPADKALISVINVQPDTSRDQQLLESNYAWAKSTLGITDSFQGKYDSSATSGTAKQFSANQSAGRLQSKREMKNRAYAHLYKVMFQFLLAYSESAIDISFKGPDGQQEFSHFDRYEFLKRDASGQLYWNDEFIFDVDPSSNLAQNREHLWDMVDVKYQAGGFGPPQSTQAQLRLWTLLAEDNFPHAAAVRDSIKVQLEQEQAMQQKMMGGVPGEMPIVQGGDAGV